VQIEKGDEVTDFAEYVRDIDDIFFGSSAKRHFSSDEERLSFREKWLGRYILKHRDSFFVALEAGRAVGYLAGCLEDPTNLDHFKDIGYFSYIDDICQTFPAHLHVNVAEAYRNRGLGGALVERFAGWGKLKSVRGLHLVTSSASRSLPFYRRYGFRDLRTFAWNSDLAVCMGREL